MSNPEPRIVPMRLQKFLARAGVASRRGSENLMTAERVTVNGRVVTELGSKVDPLVDEVAVDGKVVRLADGPVTLMLHKPAGFVTTMSDPQGRPTVAELVPTEACPGLFPVGRLDADTTGLLLFSTDGELGNGLLHPKRHVVKRYLAWKVVPRSANSKRCAMASNSTMDSLCRPTRACSKAARRCAQAACSTCRPQCRRAPPASTRMRAGGALQSARLCAFACARGGSARSSVCLEPSGTQWWRCIATRSGRSSWGSFLGAPGASSRPTKWQRCMRRPRAAINARMMPDTSVPDAFHKRNA